MNSTIPADLLELKARFEIWRANRKYLREPIPDELWGAAADISRRYRPSLVGRVLKLDPSNKRLDLSGVSRIVVWIFLHQRRRRFYVARRWEARASGYFLHFSSPAAASTRTIMHCC
jgi:hypothetical protein